ncbi:MAG TPA: pitrilysin family protein [Polyangia bacterium]|nr:pitrilysin family protein [Polyangia bacterium]
MRLSFVVALFAFAEIAQAAPPPAAVVPHVQFEKVVLPNGLQVILHVDKKLPLVHVNLWYHVGSKNEAPGRTGFAHLFEHMMLQGSKNAHEDFFTIMARAGAKGGRDSNGTTDPDRTNYFSTAPSGSLEFLLWVHSDLLATLLDGMTQGKLDNQRQVVRNERRQNYENRPYGRWYPTLAENLFPAGHPYSWPTIGAREDLEAASLDEVKAFFRRYYTPSNLSLVVSGDFDPANARRLVEKYFGSIPPGPPLVRPERWVPRLDGEKVVTVEDRVPQARVYVAWPTPAVGDPDEPALTLAGSILSDGLSSRLQKVLVHDRKLCSNVSAWADTMELAGMFVVQATLQKGATFDDVERTIGDEIGKLARSGPTPAELERARTRTLTQVTSQLQNIGAFGGVADVLNQYNVFYGDPGKLEWDVRRMLAVTPASLRAAVGKWIATPNRVVERFVPVTATRPTVAEPNRALQPALGADAPFHAPTVASTKLANGLELYVVEQHELPMVSAALVSRAGSIYDPPGKEGLAVLAADAMERGAGKKSAMAIADAFGDLGTSMRTDVTLERATQMLEVQKPKLGAAVALLADVARNASYPNEEVDLERKEQIDRIRQQEQDPQQLAQRLRGRLAFGAGHPYGRPVWGYQHSVASLSAADVRAFHATCWRPNGTALVLVGDVTLDEAKALAGKELGGWSGTVPAAPPIPPPAPMARGKIVIADHPDAAQTWVVQLYSAPAARGADYYAWQLASEILGGNASGRLYANLRQDKGYSYWIPSVTTVLSGGMAWLATGGVQTDKTRESVVELMKELKGIAGARPIGAKELEDARLGRVRNYAAGFGTNNDVAWRVAEVWSRRWPMDELQREPIELGKAALAEVQAAARRYAVPADSSLLLIGDRSKIESGVRALHAGDVIVVDAEGNPLAAH